MLINTTFKKNKQTKKLHHIRLNSSKCIWSNVLLPPTPTREISPTTFQLYANSVRMRGQTVTGSRSVCDTNPARCKWSVCKQ